LLLLRRGRCVAARRLGRASFGQRERAARLFGAADRLRETISRPFPANEWDSDADYAAEIARVRTALGEKAFVAAWEQGRAMTVEQAVTLALEGEQENQQ